MASFTRFAIVLLLTSVPLLADDAGDRIRSLVEQLGDAETSRREEVAPRVRPDTTDDVLHFRVRASDMGPEAEAIGISIATRSTFREVSFSFRDVRLPEMR